MHPSAYRFAATALGVMDIRGRRVVEAGALNVNGSARAAIEAHGPASYLATDMRDGPGVDMVCPAEELPARLGAGTADVVVSTEMLEHAANWNAAVRGMVLLLAPAGQLLLTARGPGFPVHGYPDDHWRFTPAAMREILEASGLRVGVCDPDPDPASPGVFALAAKLAGWRMPDDWETALAAIPVTTPA
jgi:O-antigen biosynthesis protein